MQPLREWSKICHQWHTQTLKICFINTLGISSRVKTFWRLFQLLELDLFTEKVTVVPSDLNMHLNNMENRRAVLLSDTALHKSCEGQ